jgi:uncharacterized OsmC-like protein
MFHRGIKIEGVAAILGCSGNTVRNWMNKGRLTKVQVEGIKTLLKVKDNFFEK